MAKVLIIDDEQDVRKMLSQVLERRDHKVFRAADGNQGIQLFREFRPDLVIADIIMPEKEGLESIRELKRLDPDVRIIAISGGGLGDPAVYLDLAAKLGAVRTFEKPVDNEILMAAIDEILA